VADFGGDFDDDAPPADGLEYLARVRREAAGVPDVMVAAEVRHGQSPGSQTGMAVRLLVRVVRKHPCVCRRLGKRRRRAADARGQFAINTFGRAFERRLVKKKSEDIRSGVGGCAFSEMCRAATLSDETDSLRETSPEGCRGDRGCGVQVRGRAGEASRP
jgi:hypothetical protein